MRKATCLCRAAHDVISGIGKRLGLEAAIYVPPCTSHPYTALELVLTYHIHITACVCHWLITYNF